METIFRTLSVFFVLSGIFISIYIIYDIFSGRRQPMKIMEAVWPLTGLWASWIGLWAYLRMGRQSLHQPAPQMKMEGNAPMEGMHMQMNMPKRPAWQTISLSTLHCGAGCTLADIAGEWFTFLVPVAIGGSLLAGQWTLDYVLALIAGIFFQYAAIRPMERLPRKQIFIKAFKIDFFSLTAWQIGMYGWMAIVMFAICQGTPLPRNSWEFWFMMQVAMFFGFFTSYPVNWLLIRLDIKHGM